MSLVHLSNRLSNSKAAALVTAVLVHCKAAMKITIDELKILS